MQSKHNNILQILHIKSIFSKKLFERTILQEKTVSLISPVIHSATENSVSDITVLKK